MSDPTADSINTAGVFFGSAFFSGLVSLALVFPYNCDVLETTLRGDQCKNLLGLYTFTEGSAAITAAAIGFALGGACSGVAATINKRRLEEAEKRSGTQ